MFQRYLFLRGKSKLVFALLIFVLLGGLFVALANTARRRTEPVSSSTSPPVSVAPAKKSEFEVEVIRLTQRGFHPKKLKRVSGQFLLVIQNETGKALPTVSVHTPQTLTNRTSPLRELTSAVSSVFREEWIDLSVGDYVLTLPGGNPEQCAITVTSKQ